ncbi:MAG: hypothetical protein GFH27_549287n355 [Chloroflexi bacterium AL-W]|nr:hypothetical protein [Chloroflexi bacterium AL-N1]NOK66629.1 hypothetical protein [Chloroflexi bacterium AL-N10]NOK72017.1 hypothetical protein [Chloroflexi bacterium AL-N5]NOK81274.1 hypothetical protein [Chloroflexi bacterium AL-W]NOK89547.1 hypothetical protein [Chloroflexi bacterium AL-N15]
MSIQKCLDMLQQDIDATRQTITDLQAHWPSEVALQFGDDPSVYDVFPHLFAPAFSALDPQPLHQLAVAERLIATALLTSDTIMDLDCDHALLTSSVLRVQAMQQEYYTLLHGLFEPTSPFWTHWQRYVKEYMETCLIERHFINGDRDWAGYTETVARQIAIGKVGMARNVVNALAELTNDYQPCAQLIESIDHYNIARQMFDDLCDWKEDLLHRQPSLVLVCALQDQQMNIHDSDVRTLTTLVGRSMYYHGHAVAILRLAIASLDRAEGALWDIPTIPWMSLIDDLRRRCQGLLNDVERIVHANTQHRQVRPNVAISLPIAESRYQQLAREALQFLIRQWHLGFGEARHIACHLNGEETNSAPEYYYGDVFQRALIADTLCDASQQFAPQLRMIIEHEVDYLLRCRNTTGVGGWTYFDNAPDIAPDADDLGQIMQVFIRTGYINAVTNYSVPLVDILLKDARQPQGGFSTWIIPATEQTAKQELHARLRDESWGSEPNPEVMANLLYALALWSDDRYTPALENGLNYLETQQNYDGCWYSKWYYGQYYGTYVCLRLLNVARPDSISIAQARQFLVTTQHEDGGWGLDERSDPLNTALALLGMASIPPQTDPIFPFDTVRKGLDYLASCQEQDGAWANVLFICPGAEHDYGSRTITTMFVLKAVLAWSPLLEDGPTIDTPDEQLALVNI